MDFFFFLLKEASPECPGTCGVGSPLTTALLLPTPHGGTGGTRGRGRSQVRGSFGSGMGMKSPSLTPLGQQKGWEG